MLVGEGVIAVGTYSMLVFLTQRLLWPLTRLGRAHLICISEQWLGGAGSGFIRLETTCDLGKSGSFAVP